MVFDPESASGGQRAEVYSTPEQHGEIGYDPLEKSSQTAERDAQVLEIGAVAEQMVALREQELQAQQPIAVTAPAVEKFSLPATKLMRAIR